MHTHYGLCSARRKKMLIKSLTSMILKTSRIKVALGQVFLYVLRFPTSLLSHQCSLLIYLSPTLYNLSNWTTSLNNTLKKLKDNPMTMGGIVEVKYHSLLAPDNIEMVSVMLRLLYPPAKNQYLSFPESKPDVRPSARHCTN